MRNLLLVLFAVLLAVGVFLLNRQKEEISHPGSEQEFAVEDVSRVNKIFLADKSNNTILLEKKGDDWMVNDKYRAMPAKVEMLLETMQNVRVDYPVPKSQWDYVVRSLAGTSTKVEIYLDGDDLPARTYHVGGPTLDSRGTYMISEVAGKVAERSYVTHIPGFDGFLSTRYITDETDWRDTRVFDYDAEDIRSVSVDYPRWPEKSFVIEIVNPDSFVVSSGAGTVLEHPYKQGITKYLTLFKNLNAEAFNNDYSKKDTILASLPFAVVRVEDQTGHVNELTVFYMPVNKRSKMQHDPSGQKLLYDLDRYYALTDEADDFVIIQQFVFGKIFRTLVTFHSRQGL